MKSESAWLGMVCICLRGEGMIGVDEIEYKYPEDLPKFLQKYTFKIGEKYWLEHPLFRIMLPFTDYGELLSKIKISRQNLRFSLRQRDWERALALIETDKYCARLILRLIEPNLHDTDKDHRVLWRLVFDCLRNNASCHRQQPYLTRLVNIKRPFREETFCGEDITAFHDLKFPLTAWRGVVSTTKAEAEKMISEGLSWTLSHKVAMRFATNSHYVPNGRGYLACTSLMPRNVIAYLPSHNEEEIIIDPCVERRWVWEDRNANHSHSGAA